MGAPRQVRKKERVTIEGTRVRPYLNLTGNDDTNHYRELKIRPSNGLGVRGHCTPGLLRKGTLDSKLSFFSFFVCDQCTLDWVPFNTRSVRGRVPWVNIS